MSSKPTHDTGPEGAERSRRESARRLAIGILAVAATLFAVVNLDDVRVDLVLGSVTMPLIVVIVGCLLIGGLIGGFMGRRSRRG
jgi:putative membrane protein